MTDAAKRLSQEQLYKNVLELGAKDPAGLLKRALAAKCERRGGLLNFVRLMWPCVEPDRVFVENWHIDAICEHLEAVTFGEITRLLINVPPGFMKSLLLNVFWPAWEWGPMKRASMRYLAASYSQDLTIRDNVKFRLIVMSPLYQEHWKIEPGLQFNLEKVGNDRTGWKLATSVGGVGTGERGDRVICFPGDTKILTSDGQLNIGDVVDGRLPVRVAGWNGHQIEWQNVEEYECHRSKRLIDVITSDGGGFTCTPDHEVFVDGKGWVQAKELSEGDSVCRQEYEHLFGVRQENYPQTECSAEILQQNLPESMGSPNSQGTEQQGLFGLWRPGLSTAGAFSSYSRSDFLQPQMSRTLQPWPEEPDVRKRSDRMRLCRLRDQDAAEFGRSREGAVLFSVLPIETVLGQERSPYQDDTLRGMRQISQESKPNVSVLFAGLQECGSRQTDFWKRQRSVCSRSQCDGLSAGMDENIQREDPPTRREPLPGVRYDGSRSRQETPGSSHRLRQGEFVCNEPSNGVPILSRQNARSSGTKIGLARAMVTSITKRDLECPVAVYNVRVAPHHNYFANGILVHNCDDPNSVKEAESDRVRDTTNHWFTEVVPTRLNDPRTSAILVIQQRTHEEDVSGLIISRGLQYEHLMIPMRYDAGRRFTTSIGWTDPRGLNPDGTETDETDGALAWPEFFTESVVTNLEATLGPYASAGQLQQSPVPRGGAIFDREWWQTWLIGDDGKIRFPQFEYVVASVDTAFTEKQENDFSAMTVWGVYRDSGDRIVMPRHVDDPVEVMRIGETERPKVMLMWGWQKRLSLHGPPEDRPLDMSMEEWNSPYWLAERQKRWGLVEWVVYTAQRWKIDHLLIETQAVGHSLEQELRRLHSTGDWGVQLIHAKGDKKARAIAVQHLFSNGLVHAPKYPDTLQSPTWCEAIIDQFSSFPKTRHKDLVDSGTHALQHLRDTGILVRREEHDQSYEDSMQPPGRKKPLYDV